MRVFLGILAMAVTLALAYVGHQFGYLIDSAPDAMTGFMSAPGRLSSALLSPNASLGSWALLCPVLSVAIFWMAVAVFMSNSSERKGEESGSARWARPSEIKRFSDVKDPRNNILISKGASMKIQWGHEGMRSLYKLPLFGSAYKSYLGRQRQLYERNKNVLVVGGSGTGKTRYFVKPNLLQCTGNYIVTDPKGSLIRETAGFLMEEDYIVKSFNTIDFARSNGYNPFYYARKDSEVLVLAEGIIANTTGEGTQAGEKFWLDAERLLYIALLGYLRDWCPSCYTWSGLIKLLSFAEAKEENENYMSSLDYIFNEIETGLRRLKKEEDNDAWGRREEKAARPFRSRETGFEWVASDKHRASDNRCPGDIDPSTGKRGILEHEDFALEMYKAFKVAAGKTLKSILISCKVRMMPFAVGELRQLLQNTEDDMELDRLGDEGRRQVIYCIMSDTQPTFNPIHAIMQWQALNLLCDKAALEFPGERLPTFVNFILDEFANIGKWPNMQRAIAVTRSRNIGVSIILQSLSQLEGNYSQADAKTIIGNCQTMLYLGGGDNDTCKEISERLGKQTIRTVTHSSSAGTQSSSSKNYQSAQRDLMDAAEVSKMPATHCLVLISGSEGFKSKKYALQKHPRYKDLIRLEGYDHKKYMTDAEGYKKAFLNAKEKGKVG